MIAIILIVIRLGLEQSQRAYCNWILPPKWNVVFIETSALMACLLAEC